MLKRISVAFQTLFLLASMGFGNTAFAQASSQIRPSLQVCPVLNITDRIDQRTLNCSVPLDQLRKLEKIQLSPSPTPQQKPENHNPAVTSNIVINEPANLPPQGANFNSDIILNLINDFRVKSSLPSFQKDPQLCTIAASRIPEMPREIANGSLHSGLYARNLPYWVTENMKYGGNNEYDTVNWWLNSPIHRAAILGKSKYACGACTGNICNMLFTSYIPK